MKWMNNNWIEWFQEEERKKREKEERTAREDEFLRSSLRGSRKLQALEKSPPLRATSGVVNVAYSTGEEADEPHDDDGNAVTNAVNNYLINAGPMQKVVGNHTNFEIIKKNN